MKANELMIGDLVIFEDNIHKITDLSLCIDGGILVHVDGHDVQIFEHEISPIHLTEELLKANGFNDKNELYANDNSFLVYDFANNHLIISYFVSGVNIVYFDMCVLFVHELQHALRLCGLNDLADNFKVK